MPRGQPGVNRVLPLVPKGAPPQPRMVCQAPSSPDQHWRLKHPLFCPFSGFFVDHPQRILSPELHKPSSLGTSHASVCLPPLLRHCPVWGIFVVPRHPFACCLASLLKSFLLLPGSTLPLSVYSPQLPPDACILYFPPRVSRFSK